METEGVIGPTLISKLVFPARKEYHCTRGHQWTACYLYAGISLQLPDSGVTSPFCIYCLDDWAKANLGIVVEDE